MKNDLFSDHVLRLADEWGSASRNFEYHAHRLGHELYELGFDLEVDFKVSTAKLNGRLEFYRSAEYLALAKFAPVVRDALRNAPRDGAGRRLNGGKEISSQLPNGKKRTLTVTEWSKQVPGKIRDLAGCLRSYMISEEIMQKKDRLTFTAQENLRKDINRIAMLLSADNASEVFNFDVSKAKKIILELSKITK